MSAVGMITASLPRPVSAPLRESASVATSSEAVPVSISPGVTVGEGRANLPFGSDVTANADYGEVVKALQSGDLEGAQDAYGKLQSDLRASQAAMQRQTVPAASGSFAVTV